MGEAGGVVVGALLTGNRFFNTTCRLNGLVIGVPRPDPFVPYHDRWWSRHDDCWIIAGEGSASKPHQFRTINEGVAEQKTSRPTESGSAKASIGVTLRR